MPAKPASRSPRHAIATPALALAAILGVTVWSGSRDIAMSADKSAWLGRWVIAAETCQNDGYDMLIEPDHFETGSRHATSRTGASRAIARP
jgi:hypothetical protein